MAKNYHRSSIHIQIHDLGHFLGKIMTLLNLYLVLLLDRVEHSVQLSMYCQYSEKGAKMIIRYLTKGGHTIQNYP